MDRNNGNPTKELGDILVTLLLCNHFNPANIPALKRCCKRIRKRTRHPSLRKMLGVWIRLDNPKIAITQMLNLYNSQE